MNKTHERNYSDTYLTAKQTHMNQTHKETGSTSMLIQQLVKKIIKRIVVTWPVWQSQSLTDSSLLAEYNLSEPEGREIPQTA